MAKTATQKELADLFTKSQQWVSKYQKRASDPMPRDLVGATAWGQRNGYLAAAVARAPAPSSIVPGGLPLVEPSRQDQAEIQLKELRAKKIQQEIAERGGDLISRAEVEEREVRMASEFRIAACEYPARARSTIERHVADVAVVDKIMEELQPLAADLLNRADPQKALKGKTRDEIRQILIGHVEELLATL